MRDLDYYLSEITVDDVDEHHIKANKEHGKGDLSGIEGWVFVATENGVVAYFATKKQALHYRLTIINTLLNDIARLPEVDPRSLLPSRN